MQKQDYEADCALEATSPRSVGFKGAEGAITPHGRDLPMEYYFSRYRFFQQSESVSATDFRGRLNCLSTFYQIFCSDCFGAIKLSTKQFCLPQNLLKPLRNLRKVGICFGNWPIANFFLPYKVCMPFILESLYLKAPTTWQPKIRFLRGLKKFCGKQNWHCEFD